MSRSARILKKYQKKKNIGHLWTQKETLCFLELIIENLASHMIIGQKIGEIFKDLCVQMKKKGYNKSGRQMKIKLKKLQEGYKRNRNNVPSEIDKRVEQVNYLFRCGPENTADLYVGPPIINSDSDEEDYEHSIIIENRIANGIENSDTIRPEVVEVRLPKELKDNPKQNIINDQSSNVKILDRQPTFQMDMLNEILEKQQSFMIKVLENQKQICSEMLANYNENLLAQSKMLMNGFLSELKHLLERKK